MCKHQVENFDKEGSTGMLSRDSKGASPQKSEEETEFSHDGRPSIKQQAEILKLIALASGFVMGTAGMISYSYKHGSPLALFISIIGIAVSAWSCKIAFLAVKGEAPAISDVSAKFIAFGVVAFGFAGVLGTALGLLFS